MTVFQNNQIRNSIFSRALNRSDVGLLLLGEFFIAAQSSRESISAFNVVSDLLVQQNIFFCFAIYVAAKRFLAGGEGLGISRGDVALAILGTVFFGIISVLGVEQLAGLVLTVVLVPLYLTPRRNANFDSALLVCAALAINSFWGPLIFQTFTGQIIGFDVTLLRWAYSILRPDIVAGAANFSTGDGFGIVLVGGCSVFNSASVAVLATTAIIQSMRAGLRGRDGVVMALVVLTMITMNTSRLILMGWGRQYYMFWHDGSGGPIIAAFEVVLIAAVAYFGACWSTKEKS